MPVMGQAENEVVAVVNLVQNRELGVEWLHWAPCGAPIEAHRSSGGLGGGRKESSGGWEAGASEEQVALFGGAMRMAVYTAVRCCSGRCPIFPLPVCCPFPPSHYAKAHSRSALHCKDILPPRGSLCGSIAV